MNDKRTRFLACTVALLALFALGASAATLHDEPQPLLSGDEEITQLEDTTTSTSPTTDPPKLPPETDESELNGGVEGEGGTEGKEGEETTEGKEGEETTEGKEGEGTTEEKPAAPTAPPKEPACRVWVKLTPIAAETDDGDVFQTIRKASTYEYPADEFTDGRPTPKGIKPIYHGIADEYFYLSAANGNYTPVKKRTRGRFTTYRIPGAIKDAGGFLQRYEIDVWYYRPDGKRATAVEGSTQLDGGQVDIYRYEDIGEFTNGDNWIEQTNLEDLHGEEKWFGDRQEKGPVTCDVDVRKAFEMESTVDFDISSNWTDDAIWFRLDTTIRLRLTIYFK